MSGRLFILVKLSTRVIVCRIRELEGSILSDLCCAFFDIYTFIITREVDYPEYACMYIASADCFDLQSNGAQTHVKHLSSMLSLSSDIAHTMSFVILEKMTLKTSLGLFRCTKK